MATHKRPTPYELEGLTESRRSTPTVDGDQPVKQGIEQHAADLTRRDMLKMSAGAALAAPLIVTDSTTAGGKALGVEGAQKRNLLFFTADEFGLVVELTDLIIPADDHSPGARAAEVAAYIDFRLSESWEEEPKKRWLDGLKLIEELSAKMHGKGLLQSTPEQRIALLKRISQNESKPESPEEKFFVELKSRTVRAYYTSKVGIHTEMEYKGNVYLKEYVGYDAT